MSRWIITLTIASTAVLASCDREPRQTRAPESVQVDAKTVPPGPAAVCEFVGPPSDEPQCECVGGTARADLGDGHMACEAGEHELARIQYGIEQGVCCQPVVPMAVRPLPPGQRGKPVPEVAIADSYPGVPTTKTARTFRSEVRTTFGD